MRLSVGMDAIGLEPTLGIGHVGNAFEEEGYQTRFVLLCHLGEGVGKARAVIGPVIGRHLHAQQQHLGASALAGLNHGLQVTARHLQRQATQGIVATEFNHHHGGLVLGEQHRQPGAPARRGVAADAGIDHAPGGPLFLQFLTQQRHPARASRQAILGTERIADHQHRACGRKTHRAHGQHSHVKVTSIHHTPILMSQALIAVSHLSKSVRDASGTLDILCDIDFSLGAQETAAIVGSSGSGKSTLLSIMAGLDTPTQGTVTVAGQDIFALDEDQRAVLRARQMGFVFQSFQLLGHLTALENVMLPLELAGRAQPRVLAREMLARVGLAERLHHYPKVLSGGEQQRVALARAFVVQPALLLADEPTGSLDPATGERIMNLMLSLNQELGTTLILVTHDPALAARCGRCLTLEAGRLVRR